MKDLIEKLEAAPEGSRAFDNQVALATGWVRLTPSEVKRRHGGWIHPSDTRKDGSFNYQTDLDSLHGTDIWRDPLPYTTSIDAALTLVPEGWWISRIYQDEDGFEVTLIDPSSDEGMGTPNYVEAVLMADGNGIPTIALALCIAALKAREVQS